MCYWCDYLSCNTIHFVHFSHNFFFSSSFSWLFGVTGRVLELHMGKCRVHLWMSNQLIQGPMWACGGSVPCSNVPWWCFECVLSPLSYYLLSFVCIGVWTKNPLLLRLETEPPPPWTVFVYLKALHLLKHTFPLLLSFPTKCILRTAINGQFLDLARGFIDWAVKLDY